MPLELEALDPLDPLATLTGFSDLTGSASGAADTSRQSGDSDAAGGLEAGRPLSLPVDLVDEDPGQPRTEFDEATLAELASTIRARGLLQPISVRPHPELPGRWLLNFGARRLRACVLAGRQQIPAYVDPVADSYSQVIENEHREALTPMDLALFVQRRLKQGDSQADIARRLGKSRAYVTYATALIDAPDWLLTLYRTDRCRGMRELHELRRLDGLDAQALQAWLTGPQSFSRAEIEAFKASVQKAAEESRGAAMSGGPDGDSPDDKPQAPSSTKEQKCQAEKPTSVRKLWAELDCQTWVVIEPSAHGLADGQVRVRSPGSAEILWVAATRLRLCGSYSHPQPDTQGQLGATTAPRRA